MSENTDILIEKVRQIGKEAADFATQANKVIAVCNELDKTWSGSSLVGHAKYFYRDFDEPPSTQRFDIEWGLINGVPVGWEEKSDGEVRARIESGSGVLLEPMREFAVQLEKNFLNTQRELVVVLKKGGFSEVDKIETFAPKSATSYFNDLFPTKFLTRDRDSATGHYIVPHIYYEATAMFIRDFADESERFIFEVEKLIADTPGRGRDKDNIDYKETYYIENSLILNLSKLQPEKYDLKKLIQMCKELNDNYSWGNYLACGMLIRAILDHIPPIFGKKTFTEVANNYGERSFRDIVLPLDSTSRNIADSYLHTQIRSREVLPNKTQVSFQANMDILLSEVIRLLK